MQQAQMAFFLSDAHGCSYLPERTAQTLFCDPHAPMNAALYDQLISKGFRRSGRYVYRPRCPACQACIPVRIPVALFTPDRSQRRTLARNQDLAVTPRAARFQSEHYELYRRYIQQRHPGGGMDQAGPEGYWEFLASPWARTYFYEFHRDRQLVAVAIVDHLDAGLSAVYTFYDPELAQQRGLGTYAVLWQIDYARQLGLKWVYLGYWIGACVKMSYKSRYYPLEAYWEDRWQSELP